MLRHGQYTRAFNALQLDETPLASFLPHKDNNRKRSKSIEPYHRRYLVKDPRPELSFLRQCHRAFNVSNLPVDDQLTEYEESLARISYLDLNSTLADEHRMKGWLPQVKCRKRK